MFLRWTGSSSFGQTCMPYKHIQCAPTRWLESAFLMIQDQGPSYRLRVFDIATGSSPSDWLWTDHFGATHVWNPALPCSLFCCKHFLAVLVKALILDAHTGMRLLLSCWSGTCDPALQSWMWAQVSPAPHTPIEQESWPAAHCRQQTRVPALTPFGQALFLPPVLSLVNIDLDVYGLSTGSGYLSAVMGHLVGDTGHVLGIERVPQLAQRSIPSLRRAAPQLCVSHPQHCTACLAKLLCRSTCQGGDRKLCAKQSDV